MLSNKDIRVENGNLIINGVKYPLDTIEIKDFKNLFVSQPESTAKTYTFSIPTNAIAELTAVLGTNLAHYYIISAGTTLRIIKQSDDVTGLNVTLDSIIGDVYNYTVTIPAYALSTAYRIS